MSLLTVNDIHTYYGKVHALKGISLTVKEGEIAALIGSKGAGKTTALTTIASRIPTSEGRILLNGEDITHLPPHEAVRRGVILSPDKQKIFPRLTVRENLEMGAFARTDKDAVARDLEYVFTRFRRLQELETQLGGSLSGVALWMLALGRAFMAKPRILLLDEPSVGLAPLMVKEGFECLAHLNAENNITILLAEQNAHAALEIAHRAYVLQSGHITHEGNAQELSNDDAIIAAYLGG